MRTFIVLALLAAPAFAQNQNPQPSDQDWRKYNYYGDDQQQPPQQQPQPRPQPVVQPQPQPRPMPIVQQQPPPQQDDWRYRVRPHEGRAPPPPRNEVRPAATAPGQVWISGFWMPRGYEHVWVPGHYAVPPAPGYFWEPARWENQGGVWNFYEGHWYQQAVAQPMEVFQPAPPSMVDEFSYQPPPPPMAEAQPPMPFGNALWIPGWWHWNGIRFAWVAGRWSARPPMYFWEPHRWVRSPDGKYREEPGHWRR